MLRRIILCAAIAAGTLAAADKPNREIQELQRDVAQLQEMLKGAQQAIEARFTALATQVQSSAEATAQVNASVAGVQKALAQMAQEQERKIVPLVAEQGSRIEQAATALTTMQQAVADLTTSVNRLQTQMVDLSNTIKVNQNPAAPPKPLAADLLKSAEADKLGGKYDLAVQGYSDYLKYYSDTPEADTALFELGMTHTAMKDYASAARDFDALAARYPDSKRLPEALFYKAKSLRAEGRAADARAACLDLRKRFPANDFAKQCAVARQ